MKVNAQILKKEDAVASLEIEVDKSSVEEKYNEIAENYRKNATISGFRKGKAPLNIIKNKYKISINKDLLEDLINNAYRKAVEDTKLTPYSLPKIDIINFNNNEALKFKVEVELFPEVELGKYTDLEFTKLAYKISKKDIDKELEKLRENFADFVLKEDKKSAENDVITADVTAYDEENNKLEKYSATDHKFELNPKAIYEEFYKGLLGKKAGETVEIIKSYEKDYHDKELAGKKIKFEIKIKEIREKKFPEVNDDFAKDVGDYKNLDELKEAIEKQLKDIADRYIESKLENDIVDEIVKKSKFSLPESLINEEVEKIEKEVKQDLQRQGKNIDALIKSGEIDEEKFKKDNRESANRMLKTYMVLREIARQNKIEVTEEKVEKEIEELAKNYKQPVDVIKKALKDNDIANIKAEIRNKKTLEFLKSKNIIKEGKPLKYDDLIKVLSGKK